MEKIKEFFKKYWAIIVGAISLLLYAFIQREKRLDAEGQKDNALADYKDQDLQTKVKDNNSKIAATQSEIYRIASDEQRAKEKAKHATDEEKIDYWKKKLGE